MYGKDIAAFKLMKPAIILSSEFRISKRYARSDLELRCTCVV
jgi:hypothetical protein